LLAPKGGKFEKKRFPPNGLLHELIGTSVGVLIFLVGRKEITVEIRRKSFNQVEAARQSRRKS